MGIYYTRFESIGRLTDPSEFDRELTLFKNFRYRIDTIFANLSNYAIFTPSTPQLRGFLDDIRREPLGLGGFGLGQAIDEMRKGEPDMLGPFELDDVFELIDWADSLQTDSVGDSGLGSNGGPIRLRIGDRLMAEPHKSVSLLEASEGALYVLFLLALVGHEQSPKIFALTTSISRSISAGPQIDPGYRGPNSRGWFAPNAGDDS